MDAARQGQQSTDDRFHPSTHEEIEKHNKLGSVRGLDGGRQPIGTIVVTGLRSTVGSRSKVLEKPILSSAIQDAKTFEGMRQRPTPSSELDAGSEFST